MTYGLTCLLCSSAVIACMGGEASAVERRFELDPGLLEQKITPAENVKRPPPEQRVPRKAEGRVRKTPPPSKAVQKRAPAPEAAGEGRMSLLKMTPPAGAIDRTAVRALWDRLIPSPQPEGALEISADNFSLTLDPNSYQVMPAADGGRIIVDANRTIPPLIRNLIQQKDPALRIVSESPASGKRFFSQMLQAAGFYSVEPDFTVEFGDDPRLSVRADYRIERTAESLLRNETVLLYTGSGRYAMPSTLQRFLGGAGFQVIEPDLPQHDTPAGHNRFIQTSGGSRFQVADTVLAALGLETEAGKSIEFSGWLQRGISLKVRVDRSFAYKGKPYVLTVFDGNPATYTLTRLLETQGVSVVLLAPEDDFRAVTGKLLAALKLPARYGQHRLWPLRETPYTVQMSGFLVRDPDADRTVFLTDREVTPLMLELITRNGYAVTGVQP